MAAHFLFKCDQFRQEGEFIDVRLKIGVDVFAAHRIVLAANSEYFYAMFTGEMKESTKEMIEFNKDSISADGLKIVLDAIYGRNLHVTDENIFEVLKTAVRLRVTNVVQDCCDHLQTEFGHQRKVDVQKLCDICTFADKRGDLKELHEATKRKLALMFKDIGDCEEFLSHIDADQLEKLLKRDDLNAPSESFVFKSVIEWIKYKKGERMGVAAKVIGAVRLGLVDIEV